MKNSIFLGLWRLLEACSRPRDCCQSRNQIFLFRIYCNTYKIWTVKTLYIFINTKRQTTCRLSNVVGLGKNCEVWWPHLNLDFIGFQPPGVKVWQLTPVPHPSKLLPTGDPNTGYLSTDSEVHSPSLVNHAITHKALPLWIIPIAHAIDSEARITAWGGSCKESQRQSASQLIRENWFCFHISMEEVSHLLQRLTGSVHNWSSFPRRTLLPGEREKVRLRRKL